MPSSLRTICVALTLALSLAITRAAETPLCFGLDTPDIPVVHTGKELLKLPPIIDNDRTLHIAIERTECKLNEGALLYVAVEVPPAPATAAATATAPRKAVSRLESLRNRLGPVVLDIQRLDSKDSPDPPGYVVRDVYRESSFPDNQTPLYLGIVQPTRPGKYAIRILSTDGNLLAKTTLTVAEEAVQPWLFVRSAEINPDAKEPLKARIDGGLGRPSYPTRYAIPLPDGNLPQFLPGPKSPAFKIEAHDAVVSVSIDHSLSNNTDSPFLARLLINDKIPSQLDDGIYHVRSAARDVKEFKDPVKFDLSLDLTAVNAQPGDRITLQLAYSPFGTDDAQYARLGIARKQVLDKSADPLLLSNTITYTLPKPASIAPATAPATAP
jgi:hypothetical protein